MKKIALIISIIFVCLLNGCATADMVLEEVSNQVSNVTQSNNIYVKTIQSAEIGNSPYTYKEVFDNFFSLPTWKHFTSEEGEEIVEFTGDCLYDEQKVKAKIQFLITEETEDYLEWETTYLSFNNVSQSRIMISALLDKAIEEYDAESAT